MHVHRFSWSWATCSVVRSVCSCPCLLAHGSAKKKVNRARSLLQNVCRFFIYRTSCVTTNGLHHGAIRSHSSCDKPMEMSDVGTSGCTISTCSTRGYADTGVTHRCPCMAADTRARASTMSAAPDGIETSYVRATSGRKFHNCESRPTKAHRARSCAAQ